MCTDAILASRLVTDPLPSTVTAAPAQAAAPQLKYGVVMVYVCMYWQDGGLTVPSCFIM